MLTMNKVCKAFRTETVETTALQDVDLEISAQEFVALIGPSGSGKSTFLNVAGLLEAIDSGTYELDGIDVSSLNDAERSRIRNEKIGFIFQSFNLISDLNVFDNVDVPLRYRRMRAAQRRERIEEVLEIVGLKGRLKHYPSQLSGGQQQRVAIARALAGKPALLLADEPTGNLDSHMAGGVMDLLLELHESGSTVVMVTHDGTLSQKAHRRVHLRDGYIQHADDLVSVAP